MRQRMRFNRYTNTALAFLILLIAPAIAFAQPAPEDLKIKKPKEYEERVLRSEKTGEKKFTIPRRFIQNTVTHYNYFYNANNKINEVIEKAKLAFQDDYSRLLPFYNYSLDVTAADSIQLDSVVYKASSAIALHDLRNDWVDNMYLLWGKSYYLQKKFDSAYLMLQYINYTFAPKEKDGYYKTIGSNKDGNTAYSISTKEKKSIPRKVFSRPPSRNDAFIWQIRNFVVQDQLAEAASLIVTLRNDPAFPKRLNNDLAEVQAYWFYKQGMWDSAAKHLDDALSTAENKPEMARWEYLLAQLYEMSGNFKESAKYYAKASNHTVDPILDIYARLYSIRVTKGEDDKAIQKNVDELLKMAKRDRYEEYQDIIYYMAAQMQLEGNNKDEAMKLLLKSTQLASNNPSQRNRAFLQLAELAYGRKMYRPAANYYDSISLNDTAIRNVKEIESRKIYLRSLATHLDIIDRQDSIQRIAAMPEEERKEFVKKLARDIRKSQGLKDDGNTGIKAGPVTAPPPSLFPPPGNAKGEWYFYNAASRTRGQADFKNKWGNNRPNVDNWRRSAMVAYNMSQQQSGLTQSGTNQGGNQSSEITFESLYDRLPLTPELLAKSNDSLKQSLYGAGKIFIQDVEDCPMGTAAFERVKNNFADHPNMDEVLFNLYYCYNKNGETAKAAAIKKLMSEKYGSSNYTTIVTTGKNPQSKSSNSAATKTYERIYDLFIEGNFQQAVAEKKEADSQYGKNYWTPQLLYIEAVYYIRQREDSTAKNVLGSIINQFPNTPLALRAANMLRVLDRRAAIEEELKNAVVTRLPDDRPAIIPDPVIPNKPIVKPVADTSTKKPPVVINQPKRDTIAVKPPVVVTPGAYANNPADVHYVVLILNKVDPVFSNEAKNAYTRYNRETYYNKQFSIELLQVDADNRLMLVAPFTNAQDALDWVDKAKPKTASEIIPWLKGGKYTYSIISERNLLLLKEKKDVDVYKAFIETHFPGKF